MKSIAKKLIPCMLLCLLPLAACVAPKAEAEDFHIDFYDSEEGIYTSSELMDFFEHGEAEATLGCSLDLDGEMLRLAKARGPITLNGGGYSITTGGDCVVRLDDGASITLNNVTLVAGADGVGCLGDASVGGDGLVIDALTNAIHATGDVDILAQSTMRLNAEKGSGILAGSMALERGARVTAVGAQSAVQIHKDDLVMEAGSYLYAETSGHYNALKCAGILRMYDGAELEVKNLGEYHGAELDGVQLEGVVTIRADGGSKGVGLFLFDLPEDYYALGYCKPELRFESGNGSLTFVQSAGDIPAPAETEQTEETE